MLTPPKGSVINYWWEEGGGARNGNGGGGGGQVLALLKYGVAAKVFEGVSMQVFEVLVVLKGRGSLKPIFHCDAKYLVLGVGVVQCPRSQNFALGIPTCWYLGAFYLTQNPSASQWNIGCVGSKRKILASVLYISCFLC